MLLVGVLFNYPLLIRNIWQLLQYINIMLVSIFILFWLLFTMTKLALVLELLAIISSYNSD